MGAIVQGHPSLPQYLALHPYLCLIPRNFAVTILDNMDMKNAPRTTEDCGVRLSSETQGMIGPITVKETTERSGRQRRLCLRPHAGGALPSSPTPFQTAPHA